MATKPLDQIRISKILGGVASPGTRRSFGGFGLPAAANEMLIDRPHLLPEIEFSDSDDAVVVKAFEKIRNGYSVDRFLSDPALVKKFNKLCLQLGLKRKPVEINRRLFAMRKRSGGGLIKPTTNFDRRGGLIEKLGPAVEFAMTKMAIRFGASVDDLLSSPELGSEFEAIARRIIPRGTAVEYRLCALQIRKAMHVKSEFKSLFEETTAADIDSHALSLGSIQNIESGDEFEGPGVVVIREPDRALYLSKYSHLDKGLDLIARKNVIKHFAAENRFWDLDINRVTVDVIRSEDVPEIPLPVCEWRLRADYEPAFNYPLHAA